MPGRESTPLTADDVDLYKRTWESFDTLRDKVKEKLDGLTSAQRETLEDEIKEYEDKAADLDKSDDPRDTDVSALGQAVTATQKLDGELDSVAASNGASNGH